VNLVGCRYLLIVAIGAGHWLYECSRKVYEGKFPQEKKKQRKMISRQLQSEF